MNPMQMWSSWLALSVNAARLGWEAQAVIALRLMRLANGGTRAQTEAQRMMTEKIAALAEAQREAAAVAVTGGDSRRVAKKVLGVYRKRLGPTGDALPSEPVGRGGKGVVRLGRPTYAAARLSKAEWLHDPLVERR